MNGLSEKIYLKLQLPSEEYPSSDQKRILSALNALGYDNVHIPLPVLQKLYPLCRSTQFQVTVTLVCRDTDWVLTDLEAGDTTGQHYGLAVDYGSTTIIMQLIDMNSGHIIDQVQALNGQTAFGSDILSRITYSMEQYEHKDHLQKATVDTFHALLEQIRENTGIHASKCPIMVVSGNTAMIHFLLKLDAWPVFASPYAPVSTDPGFFWGRELSMDFSGMVYIIPSASNYIGGDIISGLLKLDIHRNEETALFFDIGTNGELVIGNKDWIIAGAGAAGPALEGYISKFGMRAGNGAVDSVHIQNNALYFTTIGNQKPLGICGSGIIDLLAQMRLNGWINIAGNLIPGASERIQWIEEEQEYAAVYALPEESDLGIPLYFSQTDIRQYLDTKAAAYTMVESLLNAAGLSEEALRKLHLSGAFVVHSDLESAITIGLFPDLPRERFNIHTNTSLDGARIVLLDRARPEEAARLSESIYCLQFASIPDFLIQMQAAKFIPHTDLNRYPNIRKRLPR